MTANLLEEVGAPTLGGLSSRVEETTPPDFISSNTNERNRDEVLDKSWRYYAAGGAIALTGAVGVLANSALNMRINHLINEANIHRLRGLPTPNFGGTAPSEVLMNALDTLEGTAPSEALMDAIVHRRGHRRGGGVNRWYRPEGRGGRLVRTIVATAVLGGANAVKDWAKAGIKRKWSEYTVPLNIPMNNAPFQTARSIPINDWTLEKDNESFGEKIVNYVKRVGSQIGDEIIRIKEGIRGFMNSGQIDVGNVGENLRKWTNEAWNKSSRAVENAIDIAYDDMKYGTANTFGNGGDFGIFNEYTFNTTNK